MTDQTTRTAQPGEYIVWRGPGFIAHASPCFRLVWQGREYWVEWHPYCGPSRVTKNGDPYARQPGEQHSFWDGVAAWHKFGLRVDDAGNCITSAQRPARIMGVDQ